jgi:hypothetical protein
MREPEVFELRQPLQAEPQRVLDTARQALLGQGALVKQVSERELHVVCEWAQMGRSPLVGMTEGTLRLEGTTLYLRATLGGIAKVRRFALLLPLGIGGTLTTIFALIWWTPGDQPDAPWAPLVPLVAVAPWLVIAPLMGRALGRTTRKALTRLAESLGSMT